MKKVEKHFNEKIGNANKELNDFEEKNEESFEELKKAIYPDTYQIMGNLTLDNVNIKCDSYQTLCVPLSLLMIYCYFNNIDLNKFIQYINKLSIKFTLCLFLRDIP